VESSSEMLLSVLIPVYRHHPAALLEQLAVEISTFAQAEVEVLVYDDSAASDAFHWHAAALSTYSWLKIYTHSVNLGRSEARNVLLSKANGAFVWFLDGDVTLSAGTLPIYLTALQQEAAVHCSGIAVPESAPNNFRNSYSRKAEVKTAAERNRAPYRSFSAANFAMPKHFAQTVKFPVTHRGYGHEDTHFGLQLLNQRLPLRHLDAPVWHAATDSDAVFVEKSKEATENLARLFVHDPLFERYWREIRLLRIWELSRNLGFVFFITPFLSLIESRLKKGQAPIWLLNVYKLGCFERAYLSELAAKRRS